MSHLNHLDSIFNAVSVIEKLIQPLLRLKESVKCVDIDGETRFVRDAVLLLNQLDIEHPVVQYIVSVCNGFLKQYKTGGDDLLFFICQWTKAAGLLCEMGIPTSTIVKLLREVIDGCLKHVATQSIDIAKLRSEELKGKFETESCSKFVVSQDKGQDVAQGKGKNISKVRLAKDVKENDLSKAVEHISENRHLKCSSELTKVRLNQRLSFENEEQIGNAVSEDDFIDVILRHNTRGEEPEDTTSSQNKVRKPENSEFHYRDLLSSKINSSAISAQSNKAGTFIESSKMLTTNSVRADDDSIPVITLKMENLQDTDTKGDDDDFSWFFEEDKLFQSSQREAKFLTDFNPRVNQEPLNGSSKLMEKSEVQSDDSFVDDRRFDGYNFNLSDKTKNLEGVLNSLGVVHINKMGFKDCDDESISDDFEDELIRDISDLKKNIETDLKILKKRSRRNGIKKRNLQITDMKQTVEDKSNTYDEFDEIWSKIECGNIDHSNQKMSSLENECDQFVTVQFTLNKDISNSVKEREINIHLDIDKEIELNFNKIENDKSRLEDFFPLKVNDNQKESHQKSTQKDVVLVENLLKSIGKDKKLVIASNEVLNNSRHFRTFQSVNSQLTQKNFTTSTNEEWNNTERLIDDETDVRTDQNTTQNCINNLNEPRNDTISSGAEIAQENVLSTGNNKTQEKSVSISSNQAMSGVKTKRFSQDKLTNDSTSTVSGLNGLLHNLTLRNQAAFSGTNSASVVSGKPTMTQVLSLRSRHFNCSNDKDIVLDNAHLEVSKGEIETEHEHVSNKKNDIIGNEIKGTTEDLKIGNLIPECLKDMKVTHKDNNKLPGLEEVIRGLLHGADEDLVDVISKIVTRLDTQENLSVMTRLVDCYTICGVKRNPRLVQGLVMKASVDCVTSLQGLEGKQCRVLLVNADISPTFKHKGHKSMNVSTSYTVDSFYSHLPKLDRWTQQVTAVLQKLSVDVILARGKVSDEMSSLCNNLHIVAMEMVPYRQLKLISDITETDMGTYLQLVTEDNVCNGIQFSKLREDLMDKKIFSSHSLCEVVLTLANSHTQTVILYEIIPDIAEIRQQELWDCLHQVTSCLQTGLVLPGNTQTERTCVEFLQIKRDEVLKKYDRSETTSHHCLPLVCEAMRDSFNAYIDMFYCSIEKLDCAYDDYLSKTAAWKVACDTVCTIINLEYYIITGITNESKAMKKRLVL